MPSEPKPFTFQIAAAKIQLQNVLLRPDLLLDEVNLDGSDIALTPPAGDEPFRVTTGETRFRAMISEPNLNRLLTANLPPDVPLRNLQVALLSGKVRVTGQIVKIVSLPILLEAVPRVENGARVSLDWQQMKVGLALPGSLREAIEHHFNKSFDLTTLPIPVWLDELRCEPGRLTAIGKARIAWPPPPVPSAVRPFAPREPQPVTAPPSAPELPASAANELSP